LIRTDVSSIDFDPESCDLCDDRRSAVVAESPTRQALRSDRHAIDARLVKRECAACGLVRGGQVVSGGEVRAYYTESYTLGAQPEHYFYTRSGPVSRSAALASWLTSFPEPWRSARRVLEIGAGAGFLLEELARRYPHASFRGEEPGLEAVAHGRKRGAALCAPGEAGGGFDLAYSVAVIEHVPSPTVFLNDLRRRLAPGGWLFLCQPTQDVRSYDVLFIDHLHHFGTPHLQAYAHKCGFREESVTVGHPLMPNFSLHLWQVAQAVPPTWAWEGPRAATACSDTARCVASDMARLDHTLERLRRTGRSVAVFGLSEVYWLARCYSSLRSFPVVCGLDDAPDKPEYASLGFPVLRPEECLGLGVQEVILTMNAIYYEAATERLARLGLTAHPLLS
jgi:2-polyprenyl-3-methyl-5-hydroxy-6-metoxy-1,4-benzoquinol methylase